MDRSTALQAVEPDECALLARRLAAEEGLSCGVSTGCNVAAALELAARSINYPTGNGFFSKGAVASSP